MLKAYLVVMLGGALGSGLRFWLATVIVTRWGDAFPFGTLVVNVTGSFAISLFAGLASSDGPFPASILTRQFIAIGVLGGFTTFSSFSFQTLQLFSEGQWARAAANMGLSLALCLLAVWLGQVAAYALHHR